MRWSAQRETLVKLAQATGKLPQALEDEPEIDEVMAGYLKAFGVLGHYRTSNGTLDIQAVMAYAREVGEEPLEFVDILTIADRAYLDELKERNRKDKKA